MSQTNELRTLLLDYLDGLLDAAGRARVEQMLARDPDVAETLSRLRLLRGELYRSQPVEPPSPELRARVMLAAQNEQNAERSGEVRAGNVLVRRITRYAAVFAAGVLTTLALSPEPSAEPSSGATPTGRIETASRSSEAPSAARANHGSAQIESAPAFRRRIR